MSNAAERVRAYLTARAEHQARDSTHGNTISFRVSNTGEKVPLREADLEALLQTVEFLAALASRNLVREEDPTPYEYTEQEKEDRT